MVTSTIIPLVLGAVVGGAGAFAAARVRARPVAATATQTPAVAEDATTQAEEPTGSDAAAFELAAQRRALVDASIGIADQVRDSNEALWRQVTEALAAAGVSTVLPDGQPFDPEHHVSTLSEPTTDQALHQTVAATDKVGYLDGKTWLRRAEVAVYQQADQP